MERKTGWFADIDGAATTDCVWQPVLQLNGGICMDMPIWFEKEEYCEEFIRDEIIGQSMLGD